MERRVIIVCCFVGFLGLLSAATGLAAEAKRIKASQLSGCKSPRSPAFGLGLTAAVSLLIAQIILNVCICGSHRQYQLNSTNNWSIVLSWFGSVLAFLLLLSCAALNLSSLGNHYCFMVAPGLFAGAAFVSLASVALGIFCYITLTQTPRAIVMGYPLGDMATSRSIMNCCDMNEFGRTKKAVGHV